VTTRRRRAIVATSLVLVCALAVNAAAFWTASGTGGGAATASSLGSPAPVSVAASNGHAHVTWSAVPAPSGAPSDVTYIVERQLGTAAFGNASNTCAGTLSNTTVACDDYPSASGDYVYRVTARFRTWASTATSSTVTVTADTTAPTSTISFPSAGAFYNATGYTAGCTAGTDEVCGSAADSGSPSSGVNKVQVAIQRSSDSLYWNGSTWVAGISWNDASGTTSWSYAFAVGNLTNGAAYTVSSRATDNAVNVQTTPDTKSFTFDSTAPSVTLTSVNGSARTFPYLTNVNVTSVGGACTTGDGAVSVTLGVNPTTPATATCSSGTWTLTLTTALSTDGAYSFAASQTDAAGNVGSSGTKTVTIDKTPPTVTITSVNATTRTFPYTTNINVTSMGGACTTSDGVVSVTLGGSPTTPATATCSSSAWTLTLTTALSTEGTYTFVASQTDAAGNVGSSASSSVTIDKTLPSVTLTSVNGSARTFPYLTNVNVTSVGGACTTGDGAVSVTLGVNPTTPATATCSAGAWTLTFTTALSADGAYSFGASQTDAAGNVGSSGSKSVTIDKTSPTASSIDTASAGATAGRPDNPDTISFTYSEPMKASTILSGWDGSPQTVTARITDDDAATSGNDSFSVDGVSLGKVNMGSTGWATAGITWANSSMVLSSDRRTVTVTIGATCVSSSSNCGSKLNTITASRTFTWIPVSTPTDDAGNTTNTATDPTSTKEQF